MGGSSGHWVRYCSQARQEDHIDSVESDGRDERAGPPSYDVTVPAPELSALILAVHHAASGPHRTKWKYRNVIGIGATTVSDLLLDDSVADRPIAGIAVTQRGVTANVTFRVADDVATAHFCGAASRPDQHEESAWASFLATGTVDVLARDGVDTHVDPV